MNWNDGNGNAKGDDWGVGVGGGWKMSVWFASSLGLDGWHGSRGFLWLG